MPNLSRPQSADPAVLRDALNLLIGQLERGLPVPTYVTANQPAASSVPPGTIVYVSDAAAGARFQGNHSGTWVNLG